MTGPVLLRGESLSKYFPDTGILANDSISLRLGEGEKKAILGENGAGKSTLGKILAGLLPADSGKIWVHDRLIPGGSVRAAEAAGIGFVPQVSLLAPELTAAENIALGREPRRLGILVSHKKLYYEAAMLLERFGLKLDPDIPVADLSAAERRSVEIARALARGGRILILDEPTSILSEQESQRLFELLDRLAQQGTGILVVTHRIAEVRTFAQSLIVLRSGRAVLDESSDSLSEHDIAHYMARTSDDRTASLLSRLPASCDDNEGRPSTPALEARSIRLRPEASPFSFSVRPGEILAISALAGNGLSRLEEILSAKARPFSGQILIGGKSLNQTRWRALREGTAEDASGRRLLLSYVPSDREGRGLCLQANLRDNLLALRLRDFSAADFLTSRKRDQVSTQLASLLGLQAAPGIKAAALSGGNRQRLMLTRELLGRGGMAEVLDPHPSALKERANSCESEAEGIYILSEVFQGLDIAAQELLGNLLRSLADSGASILLLSSNVEEVLPLADRFIALYRGELALEAEGTDKDIGAKLLAAMTGVKP